MASQKALEARHEKILKELSRKPDNKRCANCETTGPSYVVTDFKTFVCTVCAGVHRQFGHRVKGITMASFKVDEVAALQAGGNEKCLAGFLAKWTPRDLAKPTDRNPQKVKDWIEAVYVKKRYYSPNAAVAKAIPSHPASPKADGLNGAAANIQVKRPTIEVPKTQAGAVNSAPPTATSVPFDPFGDATPPSTAASTPATATTVTATAWADFGAVPTTPQVALPSTAPTPATATAPAVQQWASFGDQLAAPAMPAAVAPPPAAPAAPAPAPASAAGWTTFGEDKPAETAAAPLPAAPAEATPPGWTAFGDEDDKHTPAAAPAAAKPQPPKELPLELFSEVQSLGLMPSPSGGQQAGYSSGYQQQRSFVAQQSFTGQPQHSFTGQPQGYGAQPGYGVPSPAGSNGVYNSYSQQLAPQPSYGSASLPAGPAMSFSAPQQPPSGYAGTPTYGHSASFAAPPSQPAPQPGFNATFSASFSNPAGTPPAQPGFNPTFNASYAGPTGAPPAQASPRSGYGANPATAAPAAAAPDAFSDLAPKLGGGLPNYAGAGPAYGTASFTSQVSNASSGNPFA